MIVIVEPHPDDAYLSIGWHLEKLWADQERTIITVYCDKKRGQEAQRYASAIGASSIVLALPESKMTEPRTPRSIPQLKELMRGLQLTSDDKVIFPLGLQHPDHYDVAASRPPNSWRYLDTPYQNKLKLSSSLQGKVVDMVIQSIVFPPKIKWRHIPIYKSQGMFFHFNKMEDFKGLPEIILR